MRSLSFKFSIIMVETYDLSVVVSPYDALTDCPILSFHVLMVTNNTIAETISPVDAIQRFNMLGLEKSNISSPQVTISFSV